MGQTLTFRTSTGLLAQLEKRARQLRIPKTVLAERYVEEGLAMEAFPGIVFRDGPAGRRPAVVGGPDVWELVEAFMADGRDMDATAETLGLRPSAVDAAIRYYATHSVEVDAWIERNREMMKEAEERFVREQELLRG